MSFLILLGFAGWPIAAYVNGRFRRRWPKAVAIRQAVLGLFVALYVGITLIDAYFANQASQPAGALTRVLLLFSILWFTLPYAALVIWLLCQRFGRNTTHPNDG